LLVRVEDRLEYLLLHFLQLRRSLGRGGGQPHLRPYPIAGVAGTMLDERHAGNPDKLVCVRESYRVLDLEPEDELTLRAQSVYVTLLEVLVPIDSPDLRREAAAAGALTAPVEAGHRGGK